MKFETFRSKSTGVVTRYPAHYADHPVYGDDLELFDPSTEEYEEDKVVVQGKDVPVEQRAQIVAQPVSKNDDKDKE